MDLVKVYEGFKIGQLGSYPSPELKSQFGRRGVKFCKDACKLAGVLPVKSYPYHNKGGIAVLGEVYCKVSRASDEILLEIIIGECGPFYRTNGIGGYERNCFIAGYTEQHLAHVIQDFLTGALK